MSALSKITTQRSHKGRRIMVYGPPGVGKSSLGADAPGVVVMPIEEGVDDLEIPAFERPTTWDEMMSSLGELVTEEHPYLTLVFDTATAAEALAQARLLRGTRANTVEKWEGGFNKWRQGVIDIAWRPLLAKLDEIRARGIDVVILGHSHVKTCKDPDSDGWDQYQLNLEPAAAALLVSWCDAVGFYKFDDVRIDEGRGRGIHTGRRCLSFEHSATAVAKNRLGLPPLIEVPLERPWSVLGGALLRKDNSALIKELEALCKQMPEERAGKALAAAKGADANALGRIVNKCRAIVAGQETETTEERIAS